MADTAYNQNYKYTYSKEVDLLDNLVNNVEQAASNLDTNTIEGLISNFKSQNYSSLRPSNQQYFDEFALYVNVLLSNIKKRKALAEQWEKKRQIIDNSYNRLQQIKKNVTNAKTISELEKAKKQYEKWKNETSKIKFGWNYNKKVDNAKAYILEKIGPEDAIIELKKLLAETKHSDGLVDASNIKSWMCKYPTNCFHEVYQKEITSLTTEALSLAESSISEDEISTFTPSVETIPSILLVNPTQSRAVHNLHEIMNRNSQDFNSLLQWIYIYRNVTFDGPYKQAISTLIPVDYGINLNNKYSIPSLKKDKLTSKQINSLVKDTVINYFGILLCGNSLSSAKKDVITDTYKHSQTSKFLSQISENEKTTDKLLQSEIASSLDNSVYKSPDDTEVKIEIPITNSIDLKEEDTVSNEIKVEISSILPEIEFEEQKLVDSAPLEVQFLEEPSSKVIDTSSSKIKSEEPSNISKDSVNPLERTSESFDEGKEEQNELLTEEEGIINPYSLTYNDIQNIEAIYTFAYPQIEKVSIEQPKVIKEPIKYSSQKTIDLDNQN